MTASKVARAGFFVSAFAAVSNLTAVGALPSTAIEAGLGGAGLACFMFLEAGLLLAVGEFAAGWLADNRQTIGAWAIARARAALSTRRQRASNHPLGDRWRTQVERLHG